MVRSPSRRRVAAHAAAIAAGTAALLAMSVLPNQAQAVVAPPVPVTGAGQGLSDIDTRVGSLAPTSAQLSRVGALGATARWNRFGTPQSVIKYGGYLGSGLGGDAVTAARAWLRANAVLFRLTTAAVDQLELVNDSRMAQSNGHAVVFRQRFGNLPAAQDGLVTVGVVGGRVAYVASSIAGTTASPGVPSLTPQQAWLAAASNVGRLTAGAAISGVAADPRTGWTTFSVAGFAQKQQARLRALPRYDGAVRPVFEVNVVDVRGGAALAYTSLVDASSGAVLARYNQVDNATETGTFQGAVSATACGAKHPFTVDGDTKSISVVATEAIVTNDIVLKLYGPSGSVVASSDTATSPEAINYAPTVVTPGVYNVEVCPYDAPTVPFVPPGNYVGTFVASDTATTASTPYPPKWKYFLSNPALNYSAANTTDNRKVGCWVTSFGGTAVPGCDQPPSPLNNLAARGPWDYNFRTNTPTLTTEGNAANTAEAWTSPLTPGALQQRPVEPSRQYIEPFTDAWNNSRCNPAQLVPGGNDILASVTSLFASHNRLHDFSYFLGFTESNYNLQDNNFGNTAPGPFPSGRELDPEIGNVQAGALTGGSPSYLGRDNANQITLQDGVPGITNQYLFQPIAGAFYSPCVDGDFDMSVVGHEYTHAISNRMVGGPDANLTGYQAGSMGESWGDQVALEYQFEHSYPLGTSNPYVEGPYVTGNKATGIRNYALDQSPLQFGDLGYDVTGPEVHADGEPWSAVMFDVRAALMAKYNGSSPSGDKALQLRCGQGDTAQNPPAPPLPPQSCPGNRRWLQLMFDAFLLQQPATSMLDARDAMLAADVMRFSGANQQVMWNAFAKRGFGQFAATATNEDTQPRPDYTSPFANEGTLRIAAQNFDTAGRPAVNGTLFIGRYEARVTPVADTDTTTPLSNSVRLAPGTYDMLFRAPGYGMRRFSVTIGAGQVVDRVLHLSTNLASKSSGATAVGSVGSLNADSLIDDTEETNWAATNQGVQGNGTGVSALKPSVTVDLAGTAPSIVRSVQVSAMLRPVTSDTDPDQESGSRFTALRQFAIETCTQSVTSNCDLATTPFTRIYTSPANAFPSTVPRPLAPDLLLRTFDVPDTSATHVRLVALHNQCTGTPEYQGEQDADPANATDCDAASDRGTQVRAAELQVFSYDASTRPPGDPVVVTTMTAPSAAASGSTITYTIGYTNLGPQPSSNARITDVLPAGLAFVSATGGGTYSGVSRTVTWNVGTVPVTFTGSVTLKARLTATIGSTVLNQATFTAPLTVATPAGAVTVVTP